MSAKRPPVQAAIHSAWIFALCGAFAVGASGAPKVPPRVEFFGCTEIRDIAQVPVCMLTPDDQLVIWVGPHACSDIQVSEADQPVAFETYAIQGGCQLRIVGRTQQDRATLTVSDVRAGKALWTLPIDRSKTRLLQWKKRIWDRANSDLTDAVPELRRMLGGDLDAETYVDVFYALAMAEIRLGERHAALRDLDHLTLYASTAKYRSIAMDAAYQRAELLAKSGLHDDSRAVLQDAASFATPGDSRSVTFPDLEAGILGRAEEHFDKSAQYFRQAVLGAERVHDLEMQRIATPGLMDLLARLDRKQETERLLDTVEPLLTGINECARARLLNTAAFAGLVLAEGQEGLVPGAAIQLGQHSLRDLFMRALSSRLKCRQDSLLANLYDGLGWLDFFEGRYAQAQSWLAKARAIPDLSANSDTDLLDLEAQLAIAVGRGDEARRLYKALDELLARNPSHHGREIQCRIAIGNLEALRLLGQEDRTVLDSVRTCVSQQGNSLAPSEVKWITRRARAAGLTGL